jgi:hypothetical protein
MSLDLEIIPGSSKLLRWGDLKPIVQRIFSDVNAIEPVEVNLIQRGTHRKILGEEELTIRGSYYFGFPEDSTLALSRPSIVYPEAEKDYLDYLTRNMPHGTSESIWQAWKRAGFEIWLTSIASRPRGELQRMADLASAIAEMVEGYVLLSDNRIFQESEGIYLPDQRLHELPHPRK